MNLAGIGIRGSSGLHIEVETFVSPAYANITDNGIITDLNNLVGSLKTNGLWTPQKAVYPIVGGNANAHSYNLKDPTLYQIAWSGGLTHNANGVTGNGSSGYGNTGIVPSSVLSLNNTHLSFYARTGDGYTTKRAMEVSDGTNFLALYLSGLVITARINTSSSDSGGNWGTTGFFQGTRTASGTGKFFRNGTNVSNTSSVSTALTTTRTLTLLAANSNGTINNYSDHNYAFFSVGDGMNTTQAANFYTAVQAFQTARGRQV